MKRAITYGAILLIGLALGIIVSTYFASQFPIIGRASTVTTSSGLSGQILEYCFSPQGNCDQLLIKYINLARSSIHIMIYEFRLKSIETSLMEARNRGIEIKLVMDRSQSLSHSSLYPDLKQSGFDVKTANVAGIMHNKVAIIDQQIVIEGSFNYTNAAVTSNAENLIVINDASIAQAYQNQFQESYNQGS